MSSRKPVVVDGASGYTGRLACESLTYSDFLVAGRNPARLEDVPPPRCARAVPTASLRRQSTSPRGLRELLRGAKVVINISCSFSLLGNAVVDAALVEGCHYVDSTGEQDFMFDVRTEYGAAPDQAAKRLVLSPSAAFLWGLGSAAADVCLETPGTRQHQGRVPAPPSLQTVASLQSMFRSARRGGYFSIAGGKLNPAPLKYAVDSRFTGRTTATRSASGPARPRSSRAIPGSRTARPASPTPRSVGSPRGRKLWNGLTAVLSR